MISLCSIKKAKEDEEDKILKNVNLSIW